MKRSTIVALASVVLCSVLNLACPVKHKDSEVRPVGPGVKADLLIYLKTGVTEAQIDVFSKEVLSRPDPEGRGDYLAPGVRTFLRIYPPVQTHEGIAITFFPLATKEQREDLKRAVGSSSIVYRILENEVPAKVKKLD